MIIRHKDTGYILGKNIKVAHKFFDRLIGLMFKNEMKEMDGLLIENTNSVHNCFVRFPIDVIFLNRELEVIKVLRSFKPWRFSWIYFRASRVLELPEGKVPETIKKGDFLEVVDV